MPLASDVEINDLARRTDGMTGADIESVCKKATLLAIAEYQAGRRQAGFIVNAADFDAVLSVTEAGGAGQAG